MKISRNIHITFIISTLLFFTSISNASLINPNLISAGVGMSTQSTQFDGESQQSTINAMFNPISPNTITASHENKRANTGIGFMNGGGYSDWDNSALQFFGEFRINDLTLSYTGSGIAEQTVRSAVHVSHASSLISGHDNSWFNMALDLGAAGSRSLRLHGSNINNVGVWEEWVNLTTNSTFNLQFNIEMVIPTANLGSGQWRGEGAYSVVLGGSPIFNLPQGYTVNSADGSIVNNYYVGNIATNVPEPITIFLFIIALLFTAIIHTKQKHQI